MKVREMVFNATFNMNISKYLSNKVVSITFDHEWDSNSLL